jgi:hypothetical protein
MIPQLLEPIEKHSRTLRETGYMIKTELLGLLEHSLALRFKENDRSDDDDLFYPFSIALLKSSVMNGEFSSLLRLLANDEWDMVREYEAKYKVIVNKRRLFFMMALCSIYSGDEVNASIYWELALIEEARLQKGTSSINSIVDEMFSNLKSISNPITHSLNENGVIKALNTSNGLAFDYQTFSGQLTDIPKLSLLTCSVRYNKICRWLGTSKDNEMVKRFSEELLSSLCILCETIFKLHRPEVTHTMLGPIINNDLRNLDSAIASQMNSIKNLYPTHSDSDFNSSIPILIQSLKGGGLGNEELRATLIHVAYMFRNKVLHEANDTRIYYDNPRLFDDAIGALFAAAFVIRNLKP